MTEPFKYLTRENGVQKLASGTATGGVPEAEGKAVALGANGLIHPSMFPINALHATTIVVEASEAISESDYINLFDDAGVHKVRKADGSQERPAHGYVSEGVALGSNATVHLSGMNKGVGLTVGTRYFLSSTTPGSVLPVPTEAAGNIIQFLGVAVPMNATEIGIQFEYDDYVLC